MKCSPAIFCLAIVATFGAIPAGAQEQPPSRERIAARRDLALAKLDLQNYWQIEYPRQRRELNAAIELTEAEIRVYEARKIAYRPFTSFTIGEPFPLTIQDLNMCRKEAEVRLNNLYAERNALIRFHGDQFEALKMRVVEARFRVAELEANDTIAAEPAAKQP
jgi:hypothetical protein